MNKIMKKENLIPVIVLAVICLIVAAVMGGVNMITAPEIERAQAEAIAESLSSVMPGGDFEEITPEGEIPSTVTTVYRDKVSGGHVVTLVQKGYADKIYMTVGISAEGKVTGAVITSQAESHGKSGIDEMVASFAGKDASGVDGVESVSGATKTSGYIKSAVYDAFVALGLAAPKGEEAPFDNGGVPSYTDEQVIAVAAELMAGSYEKITVEGIPTTVKGVYKNSQGGHAIHVATRTEWRPLETEGVVTVDSRGVITGVRMLYWEVGFDSELLDEAPVCEDKFLDSIVGKRASELVSVDLVSHATNTSTNFVNPIRDALNVLYPETVPYDIIAAAALCVLVLAFVGYGVYFYIKRRKKA